MPHRARRVALPALAPAIPLRLQASATSVTAVAMLLTALCGHAYAQEFITPGARAAPPVGARQAVSPSPRLPFSPTVRPAASKPSLLLPDTLPASLSDVAIASDAGAAPVQRASLPASRPVPLSPVLPPGEATLRLRGAMEGAWARSPELAGIPGRQAAATARGRSADSVTPGPPNFGGGFVTDGVNNRGGGREAELSIATPLWLPGEGTASRRVADADLSRLTAKHLAQRLTVAGEVREALAAAALAQVNLGGAETRLRDARTLEADVARRVRGREAAEAELLTARADRMEAEIATGERRATLDGARLAFRTLTGLEPDAAALNEPEAPISSTPNLAVPLHPHLAEADSVVAAADAGRKLASIQVRESPEIGLVGRRSREAGSERYDNRIGVQFRLPFATEARNAPRQATAEADLTEALAARENLRRQLELQAVRARIDLDTVRQALFTTRQRAALLRQQRGLSEAAFRGGQVALGDVIRVRALATEAEVSQGRAEITVRQARSRLNQSLGLLP